MSGAGCCDNKAFGEPCGNCAFDVSSVPSGHEPCGGNSGCGAVGGGGTRAERDFGFGVQMMRAEPSLPAFWKTHGTLQYMRRGGGCASDVERDARQELEGYASGILLDFQPPFPWSSKIRPRHRRPNVREFHTSVNTDADDYEPPELPGDDSSGASGEAGCCVERFDYPVYAAPSSEEHTWSTDVAFTFEWDAVYKENGGCRCDCCVFKQYVRSEFLITTFWGTVIHQESAGDGEFREDCLIVVPTGTVVGGHAEQTPVGSTVMRDPDPESGESASCLDGTWNEGGPGFSGGKQRRTGSKCIYPGYDRPYKNVDGGSHFVLRWEFLGVIHDRCSSMEIKRQQLFKISVSGSVTAVVDDGSYSWEMWTSEGGATGGPPPSSPPAGRPPGRAG